jgi:hypothetical protein
LRVDNSDVREKFMRVLNLRNAAIALVAGVGLSGCAYGPYGGVGMGVGYGNGYGYDPYYGGYGYGSQYGYGYGSPYGSYGYGYGSPYYGWNDGFYYPGTGYYVYDSNRRAHRWSDSQRRYWEQRRAEYVRRHNGTSDTTVATVTRPQWGDFSNRRSNTVRVRTESTNGNRVRVRSSDQRARQTARSSERQERHTVRLEAESERRHGRNRRDD